MIQKHDHAKLGSELTEEFELVFLWNESRIKESSSIKGWQLVTYSLAMYIVRKRDLDESHIEKCLSYDITMLERYV
jgi:uncharacterized protein YecA (UPF0149 family)